MNQIFSFFPYNHINKKKYYFIPKTMTMMPNRWSYRGEFWSLPETIGTSVSNKSISLARLWSQPRGVSGSYIYIYTRYKYIYVYSLKGEYIAMDLHGLCERILLYSVAFSLHLYFSVSQFVIYLFAICIHREIYTYIFGENSEREEK